MPNTACKTIDRAKLKELIQNQSNEDGFWDSFAEEYQACAKDTYETLLNDESNLDRLLVARNNDPKATTALFWEQVEFRAQYKPQDISPASISTALPSGAWRLCGFGKDGQVVSNYKLAHWNPEKYNDDLEAALEEYTLYVCYFVELMIRSGKKDARFSLIFDLEGFYYSMVTQTKVRHMIRRLIYVAQAQYPERLGHVYLVNAPYGFSTAWSLIKVLLDAKTASKITFCSIPELLNDIDESVLTEDYGGQREQYPIQTESIEEEAQKVMVVCS